MSRVEIVSHAGKELVSIDLSGCKSSELTPIIEEAKRVIASRPESSVLVLTNVTGTQLNKQASEIMKTFAAANKPYVKASAVVGVDGLVNIFYKAVQAFSGRNLPTFPTIDQAKEWLVAQ
jgi:hypothetical protein